MTELPIKAVVVYHNSYHNPLFHVACYHTEDHRCLCDWASEKYFKKSSTYIRWFSGDLRMETYVDEILNRFPGSAFTCTSQNKCRK